MEVTCRFAEDVAVLDLTGRFVVGEDETEVLALRSALEMLIVEGRVLIALNIARLTFIDARGLGELVSTVAMLRRSGGELMLVAPTAQVKRILSVTRLDRVLHSCDSEPDAILQLRAMHALRSRTVGRKAAEWPVKGLAGTDSYSAAAVS